MSNRFLLTNGSEVNLSDGSTTLFGATIGGSNLSASMPVKTNSTKQLVSTKLNISDINNLQSQLNNSISNPYIGTMEATDFKTNTYNSVNTELSKTINITDAGENTNTTFSTYHI